MEAECEHVLGWCADKQRYIYINRNGELKLGFAPKKGKTTKIRLECNSPECHAKRDFYIKATVVRKGRIINAL